MTHENIREVIASQGIKPDEAGTVPASSRRRSAQCGPEQDGRMEAPMRDPDHPTERAPGRSGVPSWARFVRIRKFAEITGYSERAVYMKIARGIWIAGQEYRRAPDGNICIDMEGYSLWVEGGQAPAYRR
jgi:hypothetical protein